MYAPRRRPRPRACARCRTRSATAAPSTTSASRRSIWLPANIATNDLATSHARVPVEVNSASSPSSIVASERIGVSPKKRPLATRVAGERLARPDDAMTRQDDRNGIERIGVADRSRVRCAEVGGELTETSPSDRERGTTCKRRKHPTMNWPARARTGPQPTGMSLGIKGARAHVRDFVAPRRSAW